MRGLTSGRPSATLAYVALAVLAFQIALGITAPGFAAWSPAHSHVTLDGRDHAHAHPWDVALGAQSRIPGHEADDHSQSESAPAPSRDFGIAGAAIALPAAVLLLTMAGIAFLARLVATPVFRGAAFVPATPPPRG